MSGLRGVYGALLAALQPVYRARLWWRGRREPAYRSHVAERFGRYGGEPPSSGWLWLHAVSLGETRAAAPLLAALRARRPGLRLLLTHGTATGREAGAALLREGDRQAWLPYDRPGAVARFLAQFSPAVGVLMETELWPNLIAAATTRGVPLVLANARLSPRSLARGRRLDALRRPALASLAAVLAQTADDARRLLEAGAREPVVAGNLKFDMTPDAALVERGRAWRAAPGRPVLMLASTREGEEAALVAAFLRLPAPRPLLLVVPRHPQRFDEVAALLAQAGLTVARRSRFGAGPPADADADVTAADAWVGDSLGEMALYYALADAALLGGSFAPLGGQNLIEAAAVGCPVVCGPHTFNFSDVAEGAIAAGAAERAVGADDAVRRAARLLADPAARAAAATAGIAFAAAHRGAAERMAAAIDAAAAW
jgi:3-deoxy-D-manno-octulosonic-acid transferase